MPSSFLVPRHAGSGPEVRSSPWLALWGLGRLEASLAPSRLGSTVVSAAADSVSLSSRFSNGVQGAESESALKWPLEPQQVREVPSSGCACPH